MDVHVIAPPGNSSAVASGALIRRSGRRNKRGRGEAALGRDIDTMRLNSFEKTNFDEVTRWSTCTEDADNSNANVAAADMSKCKTVMPAACESGRNAPMHDKSARANRGTPTLSSSMSPSTDASGAAATFNTANIIPEMTPFVTMTEPSEEFGAFGPRHGPAKAQKPRSEKIFTASPLAGTVSPAVVDKDAPAIAGLVPTKSSTKPAVLKRATMLVPASAAAATTRTRADEGVNSVAEAKTPASTTGVSQSKAVSAQTGRKELDTQASPVYGRWPPTLDARWAEVEFMLCREVESEESLKYTIEAAEAGLIFIEKLEKKAQV